MNGKICRWIQRTPFAVAAMLFIAPTLFVAFSHASSIPSAPELAEQVTIVRDEWGVPHVDGETDAACVFGFAYAQAEDFFWQVEDTYIQAVGRYAEIMGEAGLQDDLTNRLFEIPERSKADFETLDPKLKAICEAFAAGINYYLAKNPDVKPRLLTRWEPWYVLAFERNMILPRVLGRAHAPRGGLKPLAEEMASVVGSNLWAVGPSKTKNGTTMLFINPHQPWYGSGQFTEGHLRSKEGWNFSGATYPGGPFPTMGHNEYLGWTHTVNEPDIGDVYRETFDKPGSPNEYKYGDGYRKAEEWKATIKVKTASGAEDRTYTFRKTHHGPIMSKEDATHFLAVAIPKLYTGSRMEQSLAATKAKNLAEWREAFGKLKLHMFNTGYADRDGNILYLYNGIVPIRDPKFDWSRPVDGSDPATEWKGIHPLDDLPQVLNPISGFIQNCNSSPFTTTDDANPLQNDYPSYMAEEDYGIERRTLASKHLLRGAEKLTFEDWQELVYDTTLYWPMTQIPIYARLAKEIESTDPELAKRVKPLMDHLSDWDFKVTAEAMQPTLVERWYEGLYGGRYPAEELKPEFVFDRKARLRALADAGDQLKELYGSWQVPWGDVHRLQRLSYYPEASAVPFDDKLPSLPQVGAPGPLGVAFTVYHTPATPERKKRYAHTGASYMAAVEFKKDGVNAMSYLHYGQSGNPDSPHFFDQAKLLSEKKFKPAHFDWRDVKKHAERTYHPGE